jgi:hypothetical protein
MYTSLRSTTLALVLCAALCTLPGCPELAEQNAIIDPDDIHEISLLGIGLPAEEAINTIHAALLAKYPGLIKEEMEWTYNFTGATLGQMCLLYASTSEYILIYGSPIGSEGFSGRYPGMKVWDCMFAGEMWTYIEGQFEKTVYLPGECAILEPGVGKGWLMHEGTWMLEYTRGNIPAALPIGVFAPTQLTQDWKNAWRVMKNYAERVADAAIKAKARKDAGATSTAKQAS